MNDMPKKAPAPLRPATTVLLLRPSKGGDAASPLEVFMVVRHHQIDSFSGALVFPGGKLEDADGDPRLRQRCSGADKIGDSELKFRIAGVREAFEECGILLARKRGQRALIAAVCARKVVTVQPWLETRDGKRFLHLPPDAGYRNLVREIPPTAGR